jgi:hypothetical protein
MINSIRDAAAASRMLLIMLREAAVPAAG